MRLESRQQAQPSSGTSTKNVVIVLVVVISVLIACVVFLLWYFDRRAKRLQKEHGYSRRKSWRESLQSFSSALTRQQPPVRSDVRDSAYEVRGIRDPERGSTIDRNASIRSVMTLPAYSAVPRDNEGVIGREGERAGMDTVVEFPETNAEEEERRETEMESLYQIRTARRREAAERQERRYLRRQARERGDMETLAALRMESQRARRDRELRGSDALVAEHEQRPTSRRVSTVSYGDLGVARHDGSRVRANSVESERPLLNAQASFDISEPIRPWLSRGSSRSHRRDGSSLTIDTMSTGSYASDDDSVWSDGDSIQAPSTLHPGRSRSRPHSRSRSTARSQSRHRSRTRSQNRMLSRPHSLANLLIPTRSRGSSIRQVSSGSDAGPPAQSNTPDIEPPPYTSPVHTRSVSAPFAPTRPQEAALAARPVSDAPSLPPIERLPSIHVVDTPGRVREPQRRPSFPNFSMRRDSWSVTT